MKFLVIGCGSIGRRHINNLLSLSHEVFATDIMENNRKWVEENLGVRTFEKTDDALAQKPDAVLVCTPPSTHLALAKEALEAGANIFIEKPVSSSLQGIGVIADLAKKKGKVVQIGYNLRFAPGLVKLKKTLEAGRFGNVLYARIVFAQYLPYWRPAIDYHKGYTGKKKYGGGIILEATHELDYACWLLGKPKKLICSARKVSSLEVDTEDTADILIDFEGGAVANIHLDFVRQDYARSCEIVCENGTLAWRLEWKTNRSTLEARTFDIARPEKIKSELLVDVPWDTNDMYVDEMMGFISTMQGREQGDAATIEDGELALNVALLALESSEKGKQVNI